MKKTHLYFIWGGLYILCAGLGFIPEPEGALFWLLTGLSVAFFVPGAMLLAMAVRDQDRQGMAVIRNLSLTWLGSTLVLLLLNILSVGAPAAVGDMVYVLLVVVSSPMVCGQVWILSLFLWACLLMASMTQLKKK